MAHTLNYFGKIFDYDELDKLTDLEKNGQFLPMAIEHNFSKSLEFAQNDYSKKELFLTAQEFISFNLGEIVRDGMLNRLSVLLSELKMTMFNSLFFSICLS